MRHNFEGVIVEEDEAGNLSFVNPPDDTGEREFWCVVNGAGQVLRLMEGRAGCMDAEGILLALQEDEKEHLALNPEDRDLYEECHVYKINIKEYHQLREAVAEALANSEASIPDLGIQGKPLIRPQDGEFVKGNRVRMGEKKGQRFKKRLGNNQLIDMSKTRKEWEQEKENASEQRRLQRMLDTERKQAEAEDELVRQRGKG